MMNKIQRLVLQAERDKFKREVNKALARLQEEKADINTEYHRVSQIYLRHLERLNKKAERNTLGYASVLRWVNRDLHRFQPKPRSLETP